VLLSLTGCSVVNGIFEAVMGVGVFIVIAMLAITLFTVSELFGNNEML
jgi:hypothetical protein